VCSGYVVRVLRVGDFPPAGAIFFSSNFVGGICEPKLLPFLKKVPVIFLIDFEEFYTMPLVCFVVFDIIS
jgi:hypothetical protein